jgi:hypothetical protein
MQGKETQDSIEDLVSRAMEGRANENGRGKHENGVEDLASRATDERASDSLQLRLIATREKSRLLSCKALLDDQNVSQEDTSKKNIRNQTYCHKMFKSRLKLGKHVKTSRESRGQLKQQMRKQFPVVPVRPMLYSSLVESGRLVLVKKHRKLLERTGGIAMLDCFSEGN